MRCGRKVAERIDARNIVWRGYGLIFFFLQGDVKSFKELARCEFLTGAIPVFKGSIGKRSLLDSI